MQKKIKTGGEKVAKIRCEFELGGKSESREESDSGLGLVGQHGREGDRIGGLEDC